MTILTLLVPLNCSQPRGSASRPPSPSATPTPRVSAAPAGAADLPLRADAGAAASTGIFLGGDDHVSFGVQNFGRPIGDLVIEMSAGDRWLDHHGVAMGTTKSCEVDVAIPGFRCGPLAYGTRRGIILRATSDDAGTFHYGARFYDGAVDPIHKVHDPNGADLLVTWDETVTPLRQ